MGLFGKKELENENVNLKSQISSLIGYQNWAQQRITELEQLTSTDIREKEAAISNLQQAVAAWQKSLEDYQSAHKNWEDAIANKQAELSQKEVEISNLNSTIKSLNANISEKQSEIISLDDAILAQEFGLYEPKYDFDSIEKYKSLLKVYRDKQKQILKQINQNAKNTAWTVNGSKTEGRKMVVDTSKLLMTAFNASCDEIVRKVKFSNIEKSVESIRKQAEKISKLGRVMSISVPHEYIELKCQEAYLSYEYAKFKEEEKERLRELREQEREAKKVQKEIEEQRKKLEKERKHYSQELDTVLEQIKNADGEALAALKEKREALENELEEINKAKEDVDYREANQKAGYVYVISNIGAFGENIFKIGMTRRLDPMERIKELGDASVPFNFDVHAMIFSDDAPALESALHHEFENRKLNLVNQRREFFKCSLEEIKEAILKNYDKTVEFTDTPDAEQYRVSEKMRSAGIYKA